MEFGRVDENTLDQVHFKLPDDGSFTSSLLKAKKEKPGFEIRVGCAKWGRKDWVGKLYPKGTKDKDFLEEYARQFNCIEFNAIYYRLPDQAQIESWVSKVGDNFKFCPKFTDAITHIRRLKEARLETDRFLDSIQAFGKHLGPLFLMPHPQMGSKHLETIKDYLLSLPEDLDVFLELRHPDWFGSAAFTELLQFCKDHRRGMVITDTAGRRDCAHMQLSTREAFIRFVGNSLHPTDYTRIDDWVQRIRSWKAHGIEKIWFFMHQHEELYSPELCVYLIEALNKSCGTALTPPRLYSPQQSLF